MSCFTSLITSRLPPESILAQQKSYVTYFLPLPLSFHEKSSEITLAESRALISSSGSTGLRTWDAALHLGSYLVSALGRRLIEGKNVLELGAGTGFLSILCAKHLGARRVLATDGDSRVLEDIRVNAFLNGIEEESNLDAKPLNWGQELSILDKHKSADSQQWQIVLGADVVSPSASVTVSTCRIVTFGFQDIRCLCYLLVSIHFSEYIHTVSHNKNSSRCYYSKRGDVQCLYQRLQYVCPLYT